LPLHSDGILQNLNAPFLLGIGPFTQYFIFKIRGVLVVCFIISFHFNPPYDIV
jgi:hypothetical protein